MIIIDKPFLKKIGDKTRCICNVCINNENREIWFEVDNSYAKYLVDDRIDAYVIGLLNYAMREGENIISDFPITEELLYNIKTTLIPSLATYGYALKKIDINAPIVSSIKEGSAVGTGCSCGIDSFDAIKNHIGTIYESMNLTHLCINNVGAFNECYEDYGIDKVIADRYDAASKVADELGLTLIKTDSNFAQVIPQNHYLTNTYSCCFAIYMLQKLWKKYYLASVGLDYSKFSIIDNDLEDSAHYDLLTLQCFSNEGIRIYSESGEKSRLEKTINISDYEPAQKHLHVCINKPYNCGVCTKCKRTLVSLDAINRLDNFRQVFDIDYYKQNRKNYYRWLCRAHYRNDMMNEPSYQMLSKRREFKSAVFLYKYVCMIYYSFKKVRDKWKR